MSRVKHRSTAGLLQLSRLGFENALADEQILQALGVYGFGKERLDRCMAFYQEAFDASEAREAAAGEQQMFTFELQKAREEAWDSYQSLAKVVRAEYFRHPAMLTVLELQGSTPTAGAAFLKRAYTLFDNVLSMPELAQALLDYGYDEGRIASERSVIEAFEQAEQNQEAAKGDAQQSTIVKMRAMSRLRDDYAQFRKIARVALRENPQLLEKLGITVRG